MVGLVIVAHSAALAESVKELVEQVVQGQVPLATAGGVADPEHPFGTDAMKVLEAIRQVYSEDGVVVLMDLGSAVLSAEMALEFLSPEERQRVHLCEAPLVEGAIAAAVQAATGADVAQVLAEARAALSSKQAQIVPSCEQPAPPPEEPSPAAPPHEVRVTVRNPLGLHARPAAQFVATAARFQATITVRNLTRGTGPANAKSINQVATLGVRQGDEIAIAAAGPDAQAALAALQTLVEEGFGELEAPAAAPTPPPAAPPEAENVLQGIPASPGIALGPACLYRPTIPSLPTEPPQSIDEEQQRLATALRQAKAELEALRRQAQEQVDAYTASLFDAHLLFLEDPDLVHRARRLIREEGLRAEVAWHRAVEDVAAAYERLDDPYLSQRAADVRDVGRRVLRFLLGTTASGPRITEPCVLIAEDLLPSETLALDPQKVLGICTALGGATSHAAILARAMGIPAVVAAGMRVLTIPSGEPVALDGETGQVWIRPTPEQRKRLEAKRRRWERQQQQARRAATQPAITRDGRTVSTWANIVGAADAQAAVTFGAEGVGLFRTEFLYLDRTAPPDEEEQLAVYKEVLAILGDRPCVIRTLDVGGDKPIPYLRLPQEENPFLGWRGIRLALDRPDVLKTQLRAILRAAAGRTIRVMLPMVSQLAEVEAAQALLKEAQEELSREGRPFARDVRLGIMVETPAAALLAPTLAPQVAFFSLGTNDLSQYTMAADRTNERVAALADALHPAVLRLIAETVRAGHAAGIPVSVCGEMAADLLAVPVLVGLDVDVLSMNPPAIPRVKDLIRHLSWEDTRTLAAQALKQPDALAVRDLVRNKLQALGLGTFLSE